ncbi:hypothetical protein ACERZ8_03540 [Tateyamaria armeniaca]|uniref:Uncharacterized protein n=1 Tax=Tateyamaria armeniaca TaxID=2518930 RepID=A0ABW8USN4_9RHOB
MSKIKKFTVLLNGVSAALTGAGFYTLLEPWAERLIPHDYGWMAAAGLAGLGSVVVQGLLHEAWWRAGSEGVLRAPFNLFVGVTMSGLSWLGGAGGAMLVSSYSDLVYGQQQREVAGTVVPVRAFASDFAELRADLLGLSDEAAQLAATEMRQGGTCTNDANPSSNCGPRCRMRQRHARELAEIDSIAAGLESRARDISIAMSTAADIVAQRDIYAEAVRLQANTEQRRMADRLRSLAEEFGRELIDVHPETGVEQAFVCEDQEFAARLAALATRSAERVDLPSTAPREQQVDLSDALGCVVARVGELAWGAQPCLGRISDGPLKAAFVLEFVIVILLLGEAARQRRLGRIPTMAQRFFKEGATENLTDRDVENAHWLIRAASLYIVEAGRRGKFIAVPNDGAPDARADAMRFVRFLGESRPVLFRVPLADLDRGWTLARGLAFEDATEFDLYRWPNEADAILRQSERCTRWRTARPAA